MRVNIYVISKGTETNEARELEKEYIGSTF